MSLMHFVLVFFSSEKFKWDGGGKEVFISGTFSEWKPIPMVKSHGDFVTIVDLPEGDHEYKFCVDGDWRHDPKLVSDTHRRRYKELRRLIEQLCFAEKY